MSVPLHEGSLPPGFQIWLRLNVRLVLCVLIPPLGIDPCSPGPHICRTLLLYYSYSGSSQWQFLSHCSPHSREPERMLCTSLCSELLDFVFWNKMFALLPNFVLISMLLFRPFFFLSAPDLTAVFTSVCSYTKDWSGNVWVKSLFSLEFKWTEYFSWESLFLSF